MKMLRAKRTPAQRNPKTIKKSVLGAVAKKVQRAQTENRKIEVPPDVKRPKTGGRKLGTPNKETVAKHEALAELMATAFDGLTEDDIKGISAKKVLQLLFETAVRHRLAAKAESLAQDLLPYQEAKMVAPQQPFGTSDTPMVIKVVGGLPQLYKERLGISRTDDTDDSDAGVDPKPA